jgi:copper homeostasis protein
MNKKYLIEVCCGSVDDAIISERAGADRIELNSCMMYGGLTPSAGSIIEAKRKVNIPVMVMIRSRSGGFCYTEEEMRVMEYDVSTAIQLGADGIVFGILNEDGTIDEKRCKRIIDLCKDKEVVFHRAFDAVPNPFEAIDVLTNIGIKRILTKGQENTLEKGAELINRLIDYSQEKIEVLPGGVKIYNIESTLVNISCNQVHIANYVTQIDKSVRQRPHVFLGSASHGCEDRYELINYDFVKEIRDKLDSLF